MDEFITLTAWASPSLRFQCWVKLLYLCSKLLLLTVDPGCRRSSYRLFQADHNPVKKKIFEKQWEKRRTCDKQMLHWLKENKNKNPHRGWLSVTSEKSKCNMRAVYLPRLSVLIWWRRQRWSERCSLCPGGWCMVLGSYEECSSLDRWPPEAQLFNRHVWHGCRRKKAFLPSLCCRQVWEWHRKCWRMYFCHLNWTYLAIVRSLQGSQEVLSKNKLEPLPDCFPHMEWFRGVWFTAQPQESISPFLSPQLDLKL